MWQRKLGRSTSQRKALIRNQVTALLWNGRIETTYARAKEISRQSEKLITLAMHTYLDVYKKVETRKDKKGSEFKVEVINDGPKKLAARRRIMANLYEVHEEPKEGESKTAFRERTKNIRHPLIEKIFNELAPKYEERAKKLNNGGGYTRVLKLGFRRGDSAEKAIIELV